MKYTLERWHKNKYFGASFSLSGISWEKTAQICRLTSKASQSALEITTPPVHAMMEACIFAAMQARLQKVGKNKTPGQQYVLGQDPVNNSNKRYHQSW